MPIRRCRPTRAFRSKLVQRSLRSTASRANSTSTFFAAAGRYDERTGSFCQLDNCRTDATRSSVHENDFTLTEICVQKQSHMSRQSDEGSGGRFGIGFLGWCRIQPSLIY